MENSGDTIDNITYDELRVGQSARLARTLGKEDILAFAAVSGDINPAHLDPDFADHTLFHGVVGHGMWSAALISRLLGTTLPGPGTIYLSQTLNFLRPVRIGDELRVTATITAKDDANRHVVLDCEIRNQSGAMVLTGVATVLAPAVKVRWPRARLAQLTLTPAQAPAAHHAQLFACAATTLPAPPTCAVVHPCSQDALCGALDAARQGLIEPVFLGPQQRLRQVAAAAGRTLDGVTVIDVAHSHAAAAHGAALAAAGKVAMLMQGSLGAEELLAAVKAEPGLGTERRLSHIFYVEVPLYAQALLITDGLLNLQPTLDDKADIVRNAIDLAHALGLVEPRVAILAATPTVSPDMPATLDAAALCKMAERGQLAGARLDGPLGFDQAIAARAAREQGIVSAVAGHADILVAPDLEAGSLLVRQLDCMTGAAVCGVVAGARVPIALASGAAGTAARTASVALAALLGHYKTHHPAHQRAQPSPP